MTMSLYSRLPGGFPGVPGAVELADDVGGEGVALRAGAQRGGQFQERGESRTFKSRGKSQTQQLKE
jgi:hypothetical protein